MVPNGRGLQNRSPKQIAALVILILMALVTSFIEFPLIPGVEWLEYDASGIIAVLSALLYGPWVAIAVSVLAWIPRLINDPLGVFMNIMASIVLVLVVGLVYRQRPTPKYAVLGVVVGAVLSVLVSICLNFVVTPLYMDASYGDVAALVMPALLPFNAVKEALNGGIALLFYRRLARLLADDEPSPAGERDAGEKTGDASL